MSVTYFPDVFDAPELGYARRIILTDEGPGADTDTRWAQETPYLAEFLVEALRPEAGSVVLDYGCGVGRLAKEMIGGSGCFVVGVDISADMRRLAHEYVASDRFLALSPEQFDTLVAAGLRVDAALSVWVLQHCLTPAEDIARIGRGLARQGRFLVLNMPKRAVPAVQETEAGKRTFLWAHDDIDVAVLLRDAFDVEAEGEPDTARAPNMADAGAYWMRLKPRL